ncbi:hypothetical protein Slala04_29320 [Streptomyces lavendulae subsp. lavendulae]|nr:hypothetical protein Slala04_29320 [Streptomyces lavendulae subsp. lavendulae]
MPVGVDPGRAAGPDVSLLAGFAAADVQALGHVGGEGALDLDRAVLDDQALAVPVRALSDRDEVTMGGGGAADVEAHRPSGVEGVLVELWGLLGRAQGGRYRRGGGGAGISSRHLAPPRSASPIKISTERSEVRSEIRLPGGNDLTRSERPCWASSTRRTSALSRAALYASLAKSPSNEITPATIVINNVGSTTHPSTFAVLRALRLGPKASRGPECDIPAEDSFG